MPPISRLSSSTYWIPPSRRLSAMNSTGTSSSGSGDSADSMPRNYIDPWDLENYAYLRRHCGELDDSDPVVSLSTNGLDSAHSDFYFVPARQPLAPLPPSQRTMILRGPRRPSLMVGPEDAALVEEEDFYNARCELRTPCCHQRMRRHSVAPPLPVPEPPMVSFHSGLNDKVRARQLTTAREPPPLVYVYQTPRPHRKASGHISESSCCCFVQGVHTADIIVERRERRVVRRADQSGAAAQQTSALRPQHLRPPQDRLLLQLAQPGPVYRARMTPEY